MSEIKEIYSNHFNNCWNEHIRYKAIKDKVIYFIGTLFVTVMFGTGLLIFKSLDPGIGDDNLIILNKLYTIQYFIMHLFFLLLFFYYTYNNVIEKIFLIEAQCVQNKIRKDSNNNLLPFGSLKKIYNNEFLNGAILKVRHLKDIANIILIIVYFLFTIIPLLFKDDFDIFSANTVVIVNVHWLIIGGIGIIILYSIIKSSKYFISKIRIQILKRWELENNN